MLSRAGRGWAGDEAPLQNTTAGDICKPGGWQPRWESWHHTYRGSRKSTLQCVYLFWGPTSREHGTGRRWRKRNTLPLPWKKCWLLGHHLGSSISKSSPNEPGETCVQNIRRALFFNSESWGLPSNTENPQGGGRTASQLTARRGNRCVHHLWTQEQSLIWVSAAHPHGDAEVWAGEREEEWGVEIKKQEWGEGRGNRAGSLFSIPCLLKYYTHD